MLIHKRLVSNSILMLSPSLFTHTKYYSAVMKACVWHGWCKCAEAEHEGQKNAGRTQAHITEMTVCVLSIKFTSTHTHIALRDLLKYKVHYKHNYYLLLQCSVKVTICVQYSICMHKVYGWWVLFELDSKHPVISTERFLVSAHRLE